MILFRHMTVILTCVFQTTASDSALVSIVAARSLYTSRHRDAKLEDLVIYTTTQTHSLGVKAGLVLGLRCRSLDVRAEDQYALRGDTLRAALEEDIGNGKHPFVLGGVILPTSLPDITDIILYSCHGRDYVFRCHRSSGGDRRSWSV